MSINNILICHLAGKIAVGEGYTNEIQEVSPSVKP
jgi:hypothetical protein